MERSAREIANEFRIRGSATIEIVAGEIGLSEKQAAKLKEYKERSIGIGRPLTANMKAEMIDLKIREANPELPEGAKTHCKKWLKSYLFKRREELKNKYVNKGNEGEEDGFTLMALQLKLGMVYKNTERKRNDFAEGECDLNHNRVIFDNKCSWSLDTFPMFETEIPDPKYWWQLQNYSTLWDADKLCLCYTLINSSYEAVEQAIKWVESPNEKYKIAERMVYTQFEFDVLKDHFFSTSDRNTFIEIPEEKRIKAFYFDIDKDAQKTIKVRSEMCREYIYSLLINIGYA